MPLDIGAGILFAIAGAKTFHVALTVRLVLWSIGFALLPDIDVFPELVVRRGKLGGKEISWHRELTHFPIIYSIPAILIFIFSGPLYGFLFTFGVLAHLLHDSIGIGWGIRWFWPVKKNSYKFFSNRQNGMSWKFSTYWTSEELPNVVRQYGDPDWIKHYYFQFHPILAIEVFVFLVSLMILFMWH